MQTQKITQTKTQLTKLQIKAYHAKKGFKINLTAYTIVISSLITINMLTLPEFTWFMFPLCGWGFGLTMHYIFGVRLLGKQARAEQTKIEQTAAIN